MAAPGDDGDSDGDGDASGAMGDTEEYVFAGPTADGGMIVVTQEVVGVSDGYAIPLTRVVRRMRFFEPERDGGDGAAVATRASDSEAASAGAARGGEGVGPSTPGPASRDVPEIDGSRPVSAADGDGASLSGASDVAPSLVSDQHQTEVEVLLAAHESEVHALAATPTAAHEAQQALSAARPGARLTSYFRSQLRFAYHRLMLCAFACAAPPAALDGAPLLTNRRPASAKGAGSGAKGGAAVQPLRVACVGLGGGALPQFLLSVTAGDAEAATLLGATGIMGFNSQGAAADAHHANGRAHKLTPIASAPSLPPTGAATVKSLSSAASAAAASTSPVGTPTPIELDAVDSDAGAVALARVFFGWHACEDIPGHTVRTHITGGETFMAERAAARVTFDAVLVDVGASSADAADTGLAAPPPTMTASSFLRNVYACTAPGGIAAFNVLPQVAGSSAAVEHFARGIATHFGGAVALTSDKAEANVIVVGCRKPVARVMSAGASAGAGEGGSGSHGSAGPAAAEAAFREALSALPNGVPSRAGADAVRDAVAATRVTYRVIAAPA